jgi:hypothetical protein
MTILWQRSQAADAGSADTWRTIIRGWENRASLLSTFEGSVAMTRFAAPEWRESPAQRIYQRWPDFAKMRFYAVDRDRDCWIMETAWLFADPGAGDKARPERRRHEVSTSDGSVVRFKSIDEATWSTRSAADEDPIPGFLHTQFLMDTPPPDFLRIILGRPGITINTEPCDGVSCLHIRVCEDPVADPDCSDADHMWVDPAKGFAVRKHVILTEKDGERTRDVVQHAYDLREYAPGLWLPQRMEEVECGYTTLNGRRIRTWQSRTIHEIVEAKVNQPWQCQFPNFHGEGERRAYVPQLVADPAKAEGDGPDRAKLRQAAQELLARLKEGPGDPKMFLDPLTGLTPSQP